MNNVEFIIGRYVFVGAGTYLLWGPKVACGALLVSVGIQIIKVFI
jgi:hypothetical protein